MLGDSMLEVKGLCVSRRDIPVLEDISFTLKRGSIAVLLGPNGSGKTTLAQALLGREDLLVNGQINVDGMDVTALPTHERVKMGLFLLFQDPPRLEGIHLSSLVRRSELALGVKEDVSVFSKRFKEVLREVGIESLYSRDVNSGSGGERKRSELAQALFLPVKYVIIDEVDSGMDVDGLRALAGYIRNCLLYTSPSPRD